MKRRLTLSGLLLLTLNGAACAVRVGGGGPAEFTAAVLTANGAGAEQAAAQIRAADARVVLLSADRDSSWFAQVATASGLTLSGPGTTGPRAMAFLSDLELLGDTSLVLAVPEGGRIHMHDALYQVAGRRHLDLMMVRFEETPDVRAAVRRLIDYIATDVGSAAAVLLAIEASTPQAADTVATLMRAMYTPAHECIDSDASAAALPVQLMYGPSARMSCRTARMLTGTPEGLSARVVIGR